MTTPTLHASIIGASGYTGIELLRILYQHPHVVIHQLIAQRSAGKPIADIFSHLQGYDLPDLIALEDANWQDCDVVFCCLPHAASQAVIAQLPDHLKVIDLSADFRLSNTSTYEQWYNTPHQAPDLQKEAVYGLTEWKKEAIKHARLVACPGCYPTASSLPLIPLLQNNIISPDNIIIDAKSGVSGAGRSEKLQNLYCEVNEGLAPYAVSQHRHAPEIEQSLAAVSGADSVIQFSPHLIPMTRGILATIYVTLSAGKTAHDAYTTLKNTYEKEIFVDVLAEGKLPSTRMTNTTNKCVIGITPSRINGKIVLTSAIDNLIKGASGQAVQNMNIMFNLNEDSGLRALPVYP